MMDFIHDFEEVRCAGKLEYIAECLKAVYRHVADGAALCHAVFSSKAGDKL